MSNMVDPGPDPDYSWPSEAEAIIAACIRDGHDAAGVLGCLHKAGLRVVEEPWWIRELYVLVLVVFILIVAGAMLIH